MKLNIFYTKTSDGIMSKDKRFFPNLSKDEIDELKEGLEDNDIKLRKKIKAAKKVKVEITIKAKGKKEDSTKQTFKVMKIGRNWYLAVTDVF